MTKFFSLILLFFLQTKQALAYVGLIPILSMLTGVGWFVILILLVLFGILAFPITYLVKKIKKKKNAKDKKI